jgi:hypothetical protein
VNDVRGARLLRAGHPSVLDRSCLTVDLAHIHTVLLNHSPAVASSSSVLFYRSPP